jgi:hypothetical protein
LVSLDPVHLQHFDDCKRLKKKETAQTRQNSNKQINLLSSLYLTLPDAMLQCEDWHFVHFNNRVIVPAKPTAATKKQKHFRRRRHRFVCSKQMVSLQSRKVIF